MKNKQLQIALILGVLVPAILVLILSRTATRDGAETPKEGHTLSVQTEKDRVESMDLEAYVLGVVLGEMPASFEPEALKAQAVAARTFALRDMRHKNANVCTDSGCCQAYIAPKDYGGSKTALEKIRKAVSDTAGQVIIYDGGIIEATYFSCSGGRTEDALAVWGQAVPYLQAVDSPGEEKAENFIKTVTMDTDSFSGAFGGLTGSPESWVGAATHTEGGGVSSIQIGGKSYTGTEVRKILGLRSTAFMLTVIGKTVVITTRGSGHRVGMSQYGADAMAAGGSTYAEILAHYYPKTQIVGIDKLSDLG